MTICSSLIKVK